MAYLNLRLTILEQIKVTNTGSSIFRDAYIFAGYNWDLRSPVGDENAIQDAIWNEGLDSITDLAEFKTDDFKKIVCLLVKKPGGTIDDPASPGSHIPNPGHSIPAIAEKRLKWQYMEQQSMTCSVVQLLDHHCCGQGCVNLKGTRKRLRRMRTQKPCLRYQRQMG